MRFSVVTHAQPLLFFSCLQVSRPNFAKMPDKHANAELTNWLVK
jgi:hypothetical protein